MPSGFSPVSRDAAILRGAGGPGNTTDRAVIARILHADKDKNGLSPAMAMARRCTDANIDSVLDEAERALLRPSQETGLNVMGGDFFMRMLAQRMAPRRAGADDIAQLDPLSAARLPRVMALQLRVDHAVELRRRAGADPTFDLVAQLVRTPEPQPADLYAGRVDLDSLGAGEANALLVLAAVTAVTADEVRGLLGVAENLTASADPYLRGHGERLAGVVALRQSGRLRGIPAIDGGACDATTVARLGELVAGPRERVGYDTGGFGLPTPRRSLTAAQRDTILGAAQTEVGNVGDEVVSRDVALDLARTWVGDPNLGFAAMGRMARSADGLHSVRFSEGKAVSGGVATLNMERHERGRDGHLVRVANVHFAVVSPVIEGPDRAIAG